MAAESQRLGAAIDLIARRCYRGIPALLGRAPKPSHDDLSAAVLYRPASDGATGGGAIDWVANAACRLVDFEADLGLVSWAVLVEVVKEYATDRLTADDWYIYTEHVRYTSMTLSRGTGGGISRLSERFDRDVTAIARIVRDVPYNVARSALIGRQMPLFSSCCLSC